MTKEKFIEIAEKLKADSSIPANGIITFTHTFGENDEFVGDVVDSRWINDAYYDAESFYNRTQV